MLMLYAICHKSYNVCVSMCDVSIRRHMLICYASSKQDSRTRPRPRFAMLGEDAELSFSGPLYFYPLRSTTT
jgi:hypothetical protein